MLAGMLVCGALSAQSIKVTNTFGGDADSTGGSDLFVFENQKNEDGTYKNNFENKTRVSDRLQLDASGEKFDGRVRMNINKNGIAKFAIPFSWKCTLADIKK